MKNRIFATALACLFSAAFVTPAQSQSDGTCTKLARQKLPDAKITAATMIAAGAFLPPGKPDPGETTIFKSAPGFCRATIQATPSADSDIQIEVWLPAAGWNGKFKGVGNGGFAGYIDYGALATNLKQGYATASTDTGHRGQNDAGLDSVWALGHPEKIADFGYRAIHVMTADAKAVIDSYYGKPPARAYFASCSNGGRQGLMEAQRFPSDYDGILAGAPAYQWTALTSNGIRLLQAMNGPGYIPATKVPAIAKAVVAQCDALDGVRDSIVGRPTECHVDTAALLCKGADSDACLTAPQIASLQAIYAGARDRSGALILPGYSPGGEDGPGGWAAWITGKEQGKSVGAAFTNGFFRNMVYNDPQWSFRTASFDTGYAEANRKLGSVLDAVNPDLKPFQAHGGRLILYHGWSDPAIPAEDSIDYYNQVAATLGQQKTASFMTLYMVPGMQHCGGGPGANDFAESGDSARTDAAHDIYATLVQWVESGTTPASIVATKFVDDDPAKGVKMTRPLCRYPQEAKYKGSGDTNDAASFTCALPADK